jgi:hypothetical protein
MGFGMKFPEKSVLLALWSEVSKVENWFICYGKQIYRFIECLLVLGLGPLKALWKVFTGGFLRRMTPDWDE